MEIPQFLDEASAAWEWGNLLDFTVDDDQLIVSWETDNPTVAATSEVASEPSPSRGSDGSVRVRKRDPRLTCSNFLAGRIPCACPEIDEKDEEEAAVGKKRARTTPVGTARCQVPGCEADISELKGYHRRHRVCLRCANASSVVLDGQPKRYCQQCGKFHVLSDFDEGKRSCRRKLERHNKRRRRKSIDFRSAVENEPQGSGSLSPEDTTVDTEAGKDTLYLSNKVTESEISLELEDGHVSPPRSAPSLQNVQSDSVASFAASGEIHVDGAKENSKYAISSSLCENKNAYSSVVEYHSNFMTGIQQNSLEDFGTKYFQTIIIAIFQWLASMPVELEGYIRPGCTILTVFIAMPQAMWDKITEDATSYIYDFVSSPGSILLGKGAIHVYLNNLIFQVLKNGTSILNIKMEVQAPRLHYVSPTCFEAGKPMEFVACGSNLHQPKFRFLVSFAGKYLAYDYCISLQHEEIDCVAAHNCDHQMYKIYIPHTEPTLFGPAFIEVENESGISNYIPVLIGNREICSEMQALQQKFDVSLCSERHHLEVADAISGESKVLLLRQTAMSELLLDIAWLLKESELGNVQSFSTCTQIQRFNCLLDFLIKNNSTVVLTKVIESLKVLMGSEYNTINATDDRVRLFWEYMDSASKIVHRRFQHAKDLRTFSGSSMPEKDSFPQSYDQDDVNCSIQSNNQDTETRGEEIMGVVGTTNLKDSSITLALINRGDVMNVKYPRKPCGYILSNRVINSRPLIFMVVAAAMCFGICAVLFHPHKVGELTVTIRRCVWGIPGLRD
uniref:SBP-type domain-containing protein n=1 Tax=Nelumbo nucifera TaxID=4432 RepID=A0A822Z2F2_NELNU|nr:TPA_asm: hypothetical protein HUJ06_008512 [Nelumbo nucifera]